MPTIELTFVVDKVLNARNPAEQYVEAVQVQDYSILYRGGKLTLPIVDDGALKQFGPGLELRVAIEF